MKKSNHIDKFGNVKMIDISNKSVTKRTAIASGTIVLSKKAINSIKADLVATRGAARRRNVGRK